MSNLYILAGPNGAGKTTAAYTLLPEVMQVYEFVNADEIARGLSPFNVEGVAFEAGRIMLQRIGYLLAKGDDFALETTLATRSYVAMIGKAKQAGYVVTLIFFYLTSPEMAIQRVAKRVSVGGHHIPTDVIYRRYTNGLHNLFQLYLPICDTYLVLNNSGHEPQKIASGGLDIQEEVLDQKLWYDLKRTYGNQ